MLTCPARVFVPQPAAARARRSRSRLLTHSVRSGRRPHAVGRGALMAERIFLITAIVFSIVVPIAVMVALVYVN